MLRFIVLAVIALPGFGQAPTVQITNTTRPGSSEFRVGDQFRIDITGQPHQPVSVRTTTQSRTDWGPVVGSTDITGHWSVAGQFDKADFTDWTEAWTVGGKQATPVIAFIVHAPCIKGGRSFRFQSGANSLVTCDTADGRQQFRTPGQADPFRTPDGRIIAGRERENMTPEQYRSDVIENAIVNHTPNLTAGPIGDQAAALILKMIGVNALNDDETRAVLSIVRSAFAQAGNGPKEQTFVLLQRLADSAGSADVKKQIGQTLEYLESR